MKVLPLSSNLLIGLALSMNYSSLLAEEAEEKPEVITVYGTSNPLPVLDYPGQVTVVSRDEIDLIAPSSVSDVLRDVAGVEFSGGPRRTGETPSIRGRGGENVLILIDGARQSFTSAHDGRFFIEPELISSAEVVKGSASALYGSGAVGGVLAFETVKAEDLLGADESAGVKLKIGGQGVNDESLASITAFGRTERLDVLANFSTRQSGDIELGSGAVLPSDDDIDSALLKLSYQLAPSLNLQASYESFDNTAIEPNNGQGVAVDNDVEKDISSDTIRLAATYNPLNNDYINASLTVYQTETQVIETDESLSPTRITNRNIETTGFTIRNASSFDNFLGAETQFTVGLDWYEDEQIGTDSDTVDNQRSGVPNGEASFFGFFAQLELNYDSPFGLPGELLVIPGIRYDDFENSSSALSDEVNKDTATSPRLAFNYKPNNWLGLFANYSESFRAPSINELFLDGVHFSLPHPVLFNPFTNPAAFVSNNFVPNPELGAEETESIEFGFSVDFNTVFTDSDTFQAKASYYENDVNGLIDIDVDIFFDETCFVPFTFSPCTAGTTQSENVANARVSGYELEGIYESDALRFSVSYSAIDGENLDTGADLGILTPDRLNLDLRYKFQRIKANIGTRIQIASSFERNTFNTDTNQLELEESRSGYSVFDVYASWSPSFINGFDINVGIDNVFDRDYERVFAGVSEPGRNAYATFSWSTHF